MCVNLQPHLGEQLIQDYLNCQGIFINGSIAQLVQSIPTKVGRVTKNRVIDIKKWEHSSAGSEHLPYKQGVTGSNPVAPTKKPLNVAFFVYAISIYII